MERRHDRAPAPKEKCPAVGVTLMSQPRRARRASKSLRPWGTSGARCTVPSFKAPYGYRAYHLYCLNNGTDQSSYSGVYEWRPFRYRGGANIVDSETWPCPILDAGDACRGTRFWVARAATSQVTFGATFGGVQNS